MSDDNRIARMGQARRIGNPAWVGPDGRGRSGNPGGQPSLKKDLERARHIGIPAEIKAVLEEWREDAEERLTALGGADQFVAGLYAALQQAADRILPIDAAEARAWWWRTILPVAFAGPLRDKDSNWQYAHDTVGVRLLGKPKETIALEGGESRPVDWSKVPEAEREELLQALLKLQAYIGEPSDTEH